MSEDCEIHLDMANGPDKTVACIRAESMTAEIVAMVSTFDADRIQAVTVDCEGADRFLPDPVFILSVQHPADFICPRRNRPRNDHPKRFRKK